MVNIFAERIAALRGVRERNGWDAVVVSGSDPHSSEYPAPRWQQVNFLSGFTGEAGDVVVTADHETGGTGVDYCSYNVDDPTPVRLSFSTKGHTGTVVPVFAYGAGAESFAGVMKNTDIPKKIEKLIRK